MNPLSGVQKHLVKMSLFLYYLQLEITRGREYRKASFPFLAVRNSILFTTYFNDKPIANRPHLHVVIQYHLWDRERALYCHLS